MLLYAKTDELIQPDNIYQMSGNQISVKTLDLNQEFSEIAKQLTVVFPAHPAGKQQFLRSLDKRQHLLCRGYGFEDAGCDRRISVPAYG